MDYYLKCKSDTDFINVNLILFEAIDIFINVFYLKIFNLFHFFYILVS